MKKTLKNLIITALLIVFFVGPLKFARAEVSMPTVVQYANESRSQEGLSPLAVNSKLQDAALEKAKDMFQNQYFAHISPQGKTPWDFIQSVKYNYIYAGENLAIGYSDTKELHEAWMNSPTHRENIMNPNYREIGVAILTGDYKSANTTIVVQMFGSTESAQPVSEIKKVAAAENSSPVAASYEIMPSADSFAPKEIFQGETVNFKVSIKGEIKEAYVLVGDKKIFLNSQTDNAESFIATEKIDQAGNLKVELNVLDKDGQKHVSDLGTLKVNQKVLAHGTTNKTLMANISSGIMDHLYIYTMSIVFLTMIIAGYFALRHQKYGKLI